MRLLIVDSDGSSGLDLALRAQRDGHDVKLAIRPNGRNEKVGKGFVELVRDFREWLRWANLIVSCYNDKYLRELAAHRANGGLVIAASPETAQWEIDRQVGQAVLKKAKIQTIPSTEFRDYDTAIAHVKRTMKRYVSKPTGDGQADKALSYVSSGPDDMVFMLQRWKKLNKMKTPFILQDFIPGVEMGVAGWFGPHGWNKGWEENFEFKKLMNGDLGPACYSDDTEVLTSEGWKFWPDVTETDELATLVNHYIKFEKPSSLTRQAIDGELIGWRSLTTDILVTLGHSMYVQDDHARKPFFFEPADVTEHKKRSVLRGAGLWRGLSDTIVDSGRASLIGAYIADGHARQRSIVFGNCPEHKIKLFSRYAKDAGFEAKMYGKDLYINSAAFAEYCMLFGTAEQKFVPPHVKNADVRVICAFLKGYLSGDGSARKNGTNVSCSTISKRLADDLQELFLKVGRVATINKRDRRDEMHLINGFECRGTGPVYDLSISSKPKAEISPTTCYRQRYKGYVYCATVKSHVLLVRRNGKPVWLGNTGEQGTISRYVEKSKLARLVLEPLTKQLETVGYVGDIDVNCIIDEKGNAWPLEFTTRLGWPAFNLQCALCNGDVAEWLMSLASGKDSRQICFDKVACGVVMSIPDYPYSRMTGKEVTGIPIYGLTGNLWKHTHPCEMMMEDCPVSVEGRVESMPMPATAGDYVLVMTATGDTVKDAALTAYRRLSRLTLPNSPMYRKDIGVKLAKQLPTIQSKGFATNLIYSHSS